MSDWFYILENINIYFKLTAKLKKNKVYELTVTEYMEAAIGWLPQGTMRDPVDSQVLRLPSSRGHFRFPPWHVAFLSPIHHPHAMGLLPPLLLYTQVLGCPPSPISIYAPHYLKNITANTNSRKPCYRATTGVYFLHSAGGRATLILNPNYQIARWLNHSSLTKSAVD